MKKLIIAIAAIPLLMSAGDVNATQSNNNYPEVKVSKKSMRKGLIGINQNCKTGDLPEDCYVVTQLEKHIPLCMKKGKKRSCYIIKKIVSLKLAMDDGGPLEILDYQYFTTHLSDIK